MMGPVYPGYLTEGVVYLNFIDCNCKIFFGSLDCTTYLLYTH